jgi:hypothetical protein
MNLRRSHQFASPNLTSNPRQGVLRVVSDSVRPRTLLKRFGLSRAIARSESVSATRYLAKPNSPGHRVRLAKIWPSKNPEDLCARMVRMARRRSICCPHCIDQGFKVMAPQNGVDRYLCSACGHLSLPADPLLECSCTRCVGFGRPGRKRRSSTGLESTSGGF